VYMHRMLQVASIPSFCMTVPVPLLKTWYWLEMLKQRQQPIRANLGSQKLYLAFHFVPNIGLIGRHA
jgi:hypothetical protein